ncbi:ubiquitin-like protein Pup [Bifidobacterium biavatii]|uniref:Prokaryotic ubiquitin-like protein Pup n=1 Tax=Bifidobacterium biavatii DSM 23969 TaxID=1437608 RepID=A0A087A1X2_9BIFI|nr:ubiquitin-like protein Pup [Bifidobacterium biavatii]KFI52772.1 ubiquitin-like protein Pup [Bifidobacterium biavatii DSM 23969]
MPQEFAQAHAQENAAAQDEQNVGQVKAEAAETAGDALDSVLDDIESVLETNAEEYVSSFVQKGGE